MNLQRWYVPVVVFLVVLGPEVVSAGCSGGGCGGDLFSLPQMTIGHALVSVGFRAGIAGRYGSITYLGDAVEASIDGFWFRVNDRPGWSVETAPQYAGSAGNYTGVSFVITDSTSGRYYFFADSGGPWSTKEEVRVALAGKIPMSKVSLDPCGTTSQVTFEYDSWGRVVRQESSGPGTIIYGYTDPCDANSLLTRVWAGSDTNDYVARAQGDCQGGRWIDVDYDATSRLLTHVKYGCGTCGIGERYYRYTASQRDPCSFLFAAVTAADPCQVLVSYGYDPNDYWTSRWLGEHGSGLRVVEKYYTRYDPLDPCGSSNTLTRRDYVDNTHYRARVYLAGQDETIDEERHYLQLQSGASLTGAYALYTYSYSHNQSGDLIVTETLPQGNKIYSIYDKNDGGLSARKRGDYQSTVDSATTQAEYSYDKESAGGGYKLLLKTSTDTEGHETQYSYNSQLHITQRQDPEVSTGGRAACCDLPTNDPDYCGRYSQHPDPSCSSRQQVVQYEYDDQERLSREIRKGADGDEVVTRYVYDEYGNLIYRFEAYDASNCDPNDPNDCDDDLVLTTRYTYNIYNEPVTVTEPSGLTRKSYYSRSGGILAEAVVDTSDPCYLISATRYEYDENGWLTVKAVADEAEPFRESDLRADLADPATPTLTWIRELYEYDAYGRRIRVIVDADGAHLVTRYEYNNQSEVTKVTYSDGHWKKTERDGRGLVTAEILGKGATEMAETDFYYDLNGNLIKQVDPEGVTEVYEYDAFDRLIRSRRGQ